jgi:hypothetical protein
MSMHRLHQPSLHCKPLSCGRHGLCEVERKRRALLALRLCGAVSDLLHWQLAVGNFLRAVLAAPLARSPWKSERSSSGPLFSSHWRRSSGGSAESSQSRWRASRSHDGDWISTSAKLREGDPRLRHRASVTPETAGYRERLVRYTSDRFPGRVFLCVCSAASSSASSSA